MPDPPAEDPLAALREHVRHAHAAAERLAFEAGTGPRAADAPGAGAAQDPPPGAQTPPNGWASPEPAEQLGGELRSLVGLVESLHALLPAELREQLNELIRQILLLTRAIIDWLVERMQREPLEQATEVQDIPIR